MSLCRMETGTRSAALPSAYRKVPVTFSPSAGAGPGAVGCDFEQDPRIAISANPNGRTLIVSDNSCALRFFDARTGRENRPPFTDAMGYVPPVYSKDGALTLTIAAGDPPPGLQFLDSRTLRRIRLLRFDPRWQRSLLGAVTPFGLSPDGRTAFFTYDVTKVQDGPEFAAYLDVWDVLTGRLSTRPLGSNDVIGGRLLGDGSRLVTVTSTEVATWNTRTLRKLRSVHPHVRLGGYADVSPDGRTVAADLRAGGMGFVDAEGRVTRARTSKDHGPAFAFRFSPDGRLVATTHEDGTLNLWDPATGRLAETFLGHAGRAIGVDFSADGSALYGASLDGAIFEWGVGGDRGFGQRFTADAAACARTGRFRFRGSGREGTGCDLRATDAAAARALLGRQPAHGPCMVARSKRARSRNTCRAGAAVEDDAASAAPSKTRRTPGCAGGRLPTGR